MRGYAREIAFCQFYQNRFNPTVEVDFDFFDVEKISDIDKQYINDLLAYAEKNKEKIDATISELSHSFKIERIFGIDLALLQLAITEISGCDTPVAIVINEIIQLAKKYSTGKSAKFLNGVLASYVKGLEK